MAFFKLRKAAGEPQAPTPAPESVDALRRRARYRLAGAAILVLAGVVGFPLLFDNQPRPIAVDIPIDIPDKGKVAPLVSSNPVQPSASASVAPQAAVSQPMAAQPAAAQPEATAPAAVVPPAKEAKADSKPAAKEVAKAEAKPEPKEEVIISSSSKTATTPAPSKKDDKPAKADSKSPDATGRFIVQFGAFSDSARAHEARVKVEKAGMKTYAQVIEGPEGKKFRVRVGPFEKRSDAEKAAEKIKKLDLPATVLGL